MAPEPRRKRVPLSQLVPAACTAAARGAVFLCPGLCLGRRMAPYGQVRANAPLQPHRPFPRNWPFLPSAAALTGLHFPSPVPPCNHPQHSVSFCHPLATPWPQRGSGCGFNGNHKPHHNFGYGCGCGRLRLGACPLSAEKSRGWRWPGRWPWAQGWVGRAAQPWRQTGPLHRRRP